MIRSSRRFMACIIMFTILISVWLIVYLPPYEKLVYSKSKACGYNDIKQNTYGLEGYKGNGDISVIDASDISQSVLKDHDDYFQLRINAKNLKPMGVYRPAAYGTAYTAYETNKLKVMILRTKDSYAQYYMAAFANGEQIPVLINDRLIKLPRSGEILLPIGRIRTDSSLKRVSRESLADERYINAATGFANSYDMAELQNIRNMSAAALMIAAFIGVMICLAAGQLRR